MAKGSKSSLGAYSGGGNIEAAARDVREKEKAEKMKEEYEKKKQFKKEVEEGAKKLAEALGWGYVEELPVKGRKKKEGETGRKERKKRVKEADVEREVAVTTTPREILESFRKNYNVPISNRLLKHLEGSYMSIENPTTNDINKARRAVKMITDVNKVFSSLGIKNYKIDVVPHERAGFRLVKSGETLLFQITDTALKRGFGDLREKAKAYVKNKYEGKKIPENKMFDVYLMDYIRYNVKKLKE